MPLHRMAASVSSAPRDRAPWGKAVRLMGPWVLIGTSEPLHNRRSIGVGTVHVGLRRRRHECRRSLIAETLLAGHEPSTSTKILPSLTSYFARSSASAAESTLMAACGWRALIARIASPLSGMATSDNSCRGDAPLGFGSTVTIFHPVVMRPSSFVPAHPTPNTRRPMRSVYRTRPLRRRPMVSGADLNYSELRQGAPVAVVCLSPL